jgi:RimJ/RimL family protein N-acetyltransferase
MSELFYITTAVDRPTALEILKWRYSDEYRMYNENQEENDIDEMTDGSCLAVLSKDGGIVGFYCYGEGARAEVLENKDVYGEEGYTDIGLGLRPDLTGKGYGEEFMKLGLQKGVECFGARNFRLSVDSSNQRAVKLYQKCGFTGSMLFKGKYNGVEADFLLMKLGKSVEKSY